MKSFYDYVLIIEELRRKGYLEIDKIKENNLKNTSKFIDFLMKNEIVAKKRNKLLLLDNSPYFIYNVKILLHINYDEINGEILINSIPTGKSSLIDMNGIISKIHSYSRIKIKESIISYSKYSRSLNNDYNIPLWNMVSMKATYYMIPESDEKWKFTKIYLFDNIFNFSLNVKFNFKPHDYGLYYSPDSKSEFKKLKEVFNGEKNIKVHLTFPYLSGYYFIKFSSE
jgi:hypothetical protein